MGKYSSISIIIPSLNPTDRFEKAVSGLIKAGFEDIIIVNDGSDEEHSAPFERVRRKKECTVLTHTTNMGKGTALKTAFAYFGMNRSSKAGVVTMDGDGQHLAQDIVKCADALINPREPGDTVYPSGGFVVVGVRDFYKPDVPKRNSIGNRITAFAMRILFGLNLRDTQTGLRAIPAQYIPMLIRIKGNRFEYETNMLLELKHLDVPFMEIPIETVYEEGSNERSNFRPLLDSILIFARIAKYATSSIICFLADIGMFTLAMMLIGSHLGALSIFCSTAIARAVSSFLNFNINRLFVFKRKGTYGSRVLRYYVLVISIMLLSAGSLWLISLPFGGERSAGFFTLLKIPVDAVLFFLGYYVQRTWVFKRL